MAKTKEQIAEEAKAAELEAKNKALTDIIEAKQEQDEVTAKQVDKEQKDSLLPKTDTTAIEDARAKELIDNPAGPQTTSGLTLGQMAVSTGFTVDEHGRSYHPNDVKFNVTNPKDTSMQKGITVVSREVAEHFESLGLGKIVE